MGKRRRSFKRRDFIRAGILGGVAFSLRSGRLFATTDVSSESRRANRLDSTGEAHSISHDVIQKYGAEFGAVKPVIRRHRNGCL